jgi:hypothetical protein
LLIKLAEVFFQIYTFQNSTVVYPAGVRREMVNLMSSKARVNHQKANDGRDAVEQTNTFSTESLVEDRVDSITPEAMLAVWKKTGSSSEAELSKDEEEPIVKYGKMKKMGILIDKIMHRMTRNGSLMHCRSYASYCTED